MELSVDDFRQFESFRKDGACSFKYIIDCNKVFRLTYRNLLFLKSSAYLLASLFESWIQQWKTWCVYNFSLSSQYYNTTYKYNIKENFVPAAYNSCSDEWILMDHALWDRQCFSEDFRLHYIVLRRLVIDIWWKILLSLTKSLLFYFVAIIMLERIETAIYFEK